MVSKDERLTVTITISLETALIYAARQDRWPGEAKAISEMRSACEKVTKHL